MPEQFQVTALKWRPMRFDDVVGQEHATRTLKNAIASGRLAHAFLFTGQRGCGKTTVARILAKAVNCPNAPTNGWEPCNTCENCLAITQGRSMDVAEIDGASNNGVDDVRMLRENVKYPPLTGKYKVVIIDEVHMLSGSAFNALLKTLEEPPKHLIFVFATTEVQKVLPTILSRTQRYDFRRISLEEITRRLRTICDADGVTIEDDALVIIAKKADGSMRDAQSLLDQVIAYCGMTVETAKLREALNLIDLDFYFEVTDAIAAREPKRAFELGGEIISRGYDVEEFFGGLLEHFRNILTVQITGTTKLIEVSKQHQERYSEHANAFQEADLLRLIRLGQHAFERLRVTHDPRIVLEVTLVEMMLLERAIEISQLLEDVRALKGLTSNGHAPITTSAPRAAAPEKKTEIVTEAPPKSTNSAQKATSVPKSSPANSPAPSSSDPDPQEIANRWPQFGEFLKTKSRPLWSILPELEFCGARRSTIFFGVPGAAERGMLMNMKDEMQIALREFFGMPLQFEAGARNEMRTKAGSPVIANAEIVPQAAPTAAPSPKIERSELETALMERLGAQPV
ncbi:MAG TPA: DNA polymerase III subunit gamma/tau [Candidatus Kapabacteria bacterium]